MRRSGPTARPVACLAATLAILLAIPTSRAAGPATTQATDGRIAQLIQQLGSPDPTERDAAQTSLIQIGSPAQAALTAAAAGDDPAVAQGAASVINHLPWFTDDDPPNVKNLLAGYGNMTVDQRRSAINIMNTLTDSASAVVLRMIVREPSDAVRWAMVRSLEAYDAPENMTAVRVVPALPDSAPLLALSAWAWNNSDQRKGTDLLQRSLDQWKLALHDPTDDEAQCMMDPLYVGDVALKRYDQAADVLRTQLRPSLMAANVARYNYLLFQLFALHAQFGPLKGFDDDRALAGHRLNDPLLLYCQSLIDERMMMPEQADALRAKAAAAAGKTAQSAYDTGSALGFIGWTDLAVPQLQAFLAMRVQPVDAAYQCVSYADLQLASIDLDAHRYQQSADEQQAAYTIWPPDQRHATLLGNNPAVGMAAGMNNNEDRVEVQASLLKAAREKHDAARVSTDLDQIVGLNPEQPDIVQDVIPILAAVGRNADAQTMFDRVYAILHSAIDADPDNPLYLNNLAWFCAESGMNLDEADAVARKAVALLPTEANYIDTLATCEWKLGRPREAVRLETLALSIDHGDYYMIEQLDRFRAAAQGTH